jgi:hypothetical protein
MAQQNGVSIIETVFTLLTHPLAVVELLKDTFEPMDVLFYGIAVYEGYRFSFHEVSEPEIAALVRSSTEEETNV